MGSVAHRRPREVPTLYPAYFIELLTTAGAPTTPTNVAHLVERTAFMIGGQGAAYFAHLRDPAAFEVFLQNFARGGVPARRSYVVDDIVDWLWVWNPGCHDDLRQRFSKWRNSLLGPRSFVGPGEEIPPFTNGGATVNHEPAWRLIFAKNAR